MNKKIMQAVGFGKEVKLAEQGKCPFCQKKFNPDTEFKNELSRREFEISSLCQTCQDRIFN
jgi:uncharacterized CHY-type Zn-finger protein